MTATTKTMSERTTDDPDSIARRAFLRRIGATGLAASGVALGASHPSIEGPAGEADAALGTLLAVGVGAAAGYAASEYLLDGGDGKDPEEGIDTAEDINNWHSLYSAVEATSKFNQRSVLDADSLLRDEGLNTLNGLERMAYEEGQDAAIEAINRGATKSEVLSAAKNKADQFLLPAQDYLFDEWNASVVELKYHIDPIGPTDAYDEPMAVFQWYGARGEIHTVKENVSLLDGSSKTIRRITNQNDSQIYGPRSQNPEDSSRIHIHDPTSDTTIKYLWHRDWNEVESKIRQIQSDVHSELSTFVSETYGNVQEGDLDTDELFNSANFQRNAVEDENMNRAISDLVAMNIPVDLERAFTITTTDDDNITWQLTGFFAATQAPSSGFVVGNSYEPDTAHLEDGDDTGSVYMAVQPDNAKGEWTQYQSSIEAGKVVFDAEPLKYAYLVTTSYGETAKIGPKDFVHDSSAGTWTADVSDQLENEIAKAEKVDVYFPEEVDDWVQLRVRNKFRVDSIDNQMTGESYDSATIEEPVVDNPEAFRTQEDFKQASERREQLYEDLLEIMKEVDGDDSGGQPLFGGAGAEKIRNLALIGFGGLAGLIGLRTVLDDN